MNLLKTLDIFATKAISLENKKTTTYELLL